MVLRLRQINTAGTEFFQGVGYRRAPEGFMNETESIAWLKAQGYRVEKTDAGYVLKRDQRYDTGNVKFSFTADKLIGWGLTQTFSDGTVIVTKQGRGIAVKVGGWQQ